MVSNFERFKALEEHEKVIKYLSVLEARETNKIEDKNLQLHDFYQGDVRNCGMIAALGALSRRPEFSSEIAPLIDYSKGLLHFKMFCEGEEVLVTVDDRLFYDIEKNYKFLVYACSMRGDDQERDLVCLSSFFEKAFVKHACYRDYQVSDWTDAGFVFSCFSNNMTSFVTYDADESKKTFMEHLRYEIDNNSSVVIGIMPNLDSSVDSEDVGHCYTVIGYSEQEKAVKLYDPNSFDPCTSSECLPSSLTMNADHDNGQFWLVLKELEQRAVMIDALHSENMYKSVYHFKQKISQAEFDENNV